ncbi:MAG: hypothetical protein FJX00_02930 [Alphaproteobacteria bacterium]|nr:hypothetical protein [Alphaproteobacteria bacterium]
MTKTQKYAKPLYHLKCGKNRTSPTFFIKPDAAVTVNGFTAPDDAANGFGDHTWGILLTLSSPHYSCVQVCALFCIEHVNTIVQDSLAMRL